MLFTEAQGWQRAVQVLTVPLQGLALLAQLNWPQHSSRTLTAVLDSAHAPLEITEGSFCLEHRLALAQCQAVRLRRE